jgi:NarL family two-component system response regulator LiaR
MDLIKVLIVEDDPDWIKALTFFLNREEDICIIGSTSDKENAVQMVRSLEIDIILMDMALDENKTGGIIITEELSKLNKARIIVLSSLADKGIIAKSLSAGAVKFVSKTEYRELPGILRSVFRDAHN